MRPEFVINMGLIAVFFLSTLAFLLYLRNRASAPNTEE